MTAPDFFVYAPERVDPATTTLPNLIAGCLAKLAAPWGRRNNPLRRSLACSYRRLPKIVELGAPGS